MKRVDLIYMLIEMSISAAKKEPVKPYYWQYSDGKISKIIHCDMIHQRFTIDNFYEISFARALTEERVVELEE